MFSEHHPSTFNAQPYFFLSFPYMPYLIQGHMLIPATTGQEAWYTLDRSPVLLQGHHRDNQDKQA